MILNFCPRRRQLLKYLALFFAIYFILRVLFRIETREDKSGPPILVSQRGNEHYFTTKALLNLKIYDSKHHLQSKGREKDISTESQVTYGKLNVHTWSEICGDDINSFKNHVLFPKFPSKRFYAQTTRFHHGAANFDYGERIFGFLQPKLTGSHSFRILGRSLEVWIGIDSGPLSPKLVYKSSNLHDTFGEFKLTFVAGTKYYIEILHKKGVLEGKFSLTWKIPGSSKFVELSGSDIAVKLLDKYLQNGEVDSDEHVMEIPEIHGKPLFPKLNKQEQHRDELYKLPLVADKIIKDVLPSCVYKPSYLVDHPITNFKGVWETHYNSLYPIDQTNVTRDGWVCLGNDVLDKNNAIQIVKAYMTSLNQQHSGYVFLTANIPNYIYNTTWQI